MRLSEAESPAKPRFYVRKHGKITGVPHWSVDDRQSGHTHPDGLSVFFNENDASEKARYLNCIFDGWGLDR